MEVVTIEKLMMLKVDCAVAIGFFDGVHLGHQAVIKNAIMNETMNAIINDGEDRLKSVVITFDRSPKVALGYAEDDGNVTPLADKLRLFEEMGIDYTLVLKFDPAFLNLTAEEFIQTYLLKINAHRVSVGFDFSFGRGGVGNTDYLANQEEFKVEVIHPVLISGEKVSTTRIKECLKADHLASVNEMLGRRFSVSGEVIYGKQLGRTIGFPTANIKLDEGYYLPLHGVYVTVSEIDGMKFPSMTNIGFNPTVDSQTTLSVETHLLDCDMDMYGKKLRLEFCEKIRDEMKFEHIEGLTVQLEKDKKFVERLSIQA